MNSELIGLAFAAGMVAAFNPCGFAMLPAYLHDGGVPQCRVGHGAGTCGASGAAKFGRRICPCHNA